MIRRGALLAALLLGIVAWLVSERIARQMPDFEVYYTAAGRARAAEPLYRLDDGHYQFKYLPAFAVLASPLTWAPMLAAKRMWFIGSVLLLVTLVSLSVSLPARPQEPAWLLSGAVVLAMGKFYGHELVLGQVNVLFAVVVVAALHAMKRGHEAGAGALLALAIVIKPYAVLFLPWLLARRRSAAVAAAAGGLVVVATVPAAIYGVAGAIDLHAAWWRTVTASTAPNLLNADNVSMAAMAAKWIGPGTPAAFLAAAASVLLLVVAARLFRRRDSVTTFPEGLEGAVLLTCIPLISPQGWDYVLLTATPAIVYLVNERGQLSAPWRIAGLTAAGVAGLSLFDVMGRAAYATFMAWSIVSVCYIIVVLALGTMRDRRPAPA